MRSGMTCSVCIFARDEEQKLHYSVGALGLAGLRADDSVHILVNGCKDSTLLVAHALAEADSRISVYELPVGDKANAWNEYVHRIADLNHETHVFLDGDITPSVNSITALERTIFQSPESRAAAALPASGRSRRQWARMLLSHHYLSGNLYALSVSAIAAFRQKNICLPFGAKGEDGLISYLLLTDLKGGKDDSFINRIAISEEATFEFESLQVNLRDARIYLRRLARYSERYFQKQLLYKRLKTKGVSSMPESIYEIYTPEAFASLRPRLDPVNFWIDLATLRRLRALSGSASLAR